MLALTLSLVVPSALLHGSGEPIADKMTNFSAITDEGERSKKLFKLDLRWVRSVYEVERILRPYAEYINYTSQYCLFGQSLLHEAITNQNIHVFKWLLENGADIKKRDKFNRTPLDYAKYEMENAINIQRGDLIIAGLFGRQKERDKQEISKKMLFLESVIKNLSKKLE